MFTQDMYERISQIANVFVKTMGVGKYNNIIKILKK